MNCIFICAECKQSFEDEADDEYDDQPCPECGEMCTPFTPVDSGVDSAYD